MHIDRQRLLETALRTLRKMSSHKIAKGNGQTWGEVLDMDFVEWLTEVIVMSDPKQNCIIMGNMSDWDGLDKSKSMLHLKDGLGLPIGNLTSQLFSNIYLNIFDQYMKRVLHCRYYGRYVDDAAVISCDRVWLMSLVPHIRSFLSSELGLELHMGKLKVSEVHRGVEFLGKYIKPWRIYMSNHAMKRIRSKVDEIDYSHRKSALRSVNSYLGILRHTASYNIRRQLFFNKETANLGVFDDGMNKLIERK